MIKKYFFTIVPIIISLFGLYYTHRVDQRTKYDEKPSFNIVQNLWNSSEPSFTFVNESTKKLAQPPYHTYLLMIPSKIYWKADNKVYSNLILSPISYQVITKQTDSFKATGDIETSYLPKEFFAKKGSRDIIESKEVSLNNSLKAKVATYPMLVIYCKGSYRYSGEKRLHSINFLSTPIDKINLSSKDSKNLNSYIRDNSNLELKVIKNQSIYQTANDNISKKFNKLVKNGAKSDKDGYFIGGKKGGYGYVLKKINYLISPHDPIDD